MRRKSCSERMARTTVEPRPPGSGLYMRISTPGRKAMPITSAFLPVELKSSSRMRTRTPRLAARRTSCNRRAVLSSPWMA